MIGLGLSFWRGTDGGGAAGNSAEVQQFFDRLITLPSAPRQTLYANLINGLVSDGAWTMLDALYTYAAADSGTSLVNLKSSSFLGTLDGVPTFTVDRGWSNCMAPGVTSVNTNFNPATAGGNYTQDNAMICAWQIGATQENRNLFETIGSSKVYMTPLWSDGKTYWAINGNGGDVISTLGVDCSGFWLAQRTAAGACALNRNGAQVATSTNASAALQNTNIVAGPLLNKVAALALGASLSAPQKTTIYTRLQTYLQAVGAV